MQRRPGDACRRRGVHRPRPLVQRSQPRRSGRNWALTQRLGFQCTRPPSCWSVTDRMRCRRRRLSRVGAGFSCSTAATCRSILVAAAIVSLAVKQWSTGVLLVLITMLNAVVGLRQEGKAESAMNALKAMVKGDREGAPRRIRGRDPR